MNALVEAIAVIVAAPLLIKPLSRGVTVRVRLRPRLIPGGYALAAVVVLIIAVAAAKP